MQNITRTLSLAILAILFFGCEKNILNNPPVVNAGSDVEIQAPASMVELTATASDDDDTVVVYSWSKIAGPGAVTIENPGAISTRITGLQTGEYHFRFAAIDGYGGVSADTVMVVVKPVKPVEYVWQSYQPHHNNDEVHLFGSSTIDQTDPNAPELLAGSGTYLGEPVNIRAILQFDLANIPANAIIDSAVLTLYSNHTPLNGQYGAANEGTDNSLYIRRVAEAWSYQFITWLNQPSVNTENQVLVPHTPEQFEDLQVDVKELVQSMVNSNNFGFMISLQNEAPFTFRIFCSSKYTDETRHPRLEIKYHLE